jgi:hypothetical protein
VPIVASGAWTADDVFTMVIRIYETPFFHTVIYHIDDDKLSIETKLNVSFEGAKSQMIMAHMI